MRINSKPTKISLICISALGILFVVTYTALSLQKKIHSDYQNLAAEVTTPLEEELVDAGAQKVCDGGDNGLGTDNKAPYYRSYLEFSRPTPDATTQATKAASDNGYKLIHANPENRSFLGGVADIYIYKWYFDDSSKRNPYSNLKNGNVHLAIVIEEAGSENPCNSSTKVPEGHTFIGIEVQLPEYK